MTWAPEIYVPVIVRSPALRRVHTVVRLAAHNTIRAAASSAAIWAAQECAQISAWSTVDWASRSEPNARDIPLELSAASSAKGSIRS